jgi:hypothetical protein
VPEGAQRVGQRAGGARGTRARDRIRQCRQRLPPVAAADLQAPERRQDLALRLGVAGRAHERQRALVRVGRGREVARGGVERADLASAGLRIVVPSVARRVARVAVASAARRLPYSSATATLASVEARRREPASC